MIILGLTGSIGMGKSTTAGMFRKEGIPVHDADLSVHTLYAGEAAPLIEAAFPGTNKNGIVDRRKLAEYVVGKPEALKKLEKIVHPLVARQREIFLQNSWISGFFRFFSDNTGVKTRIFLVSTERFFLQGDKNELKFSCFFEALFN